MKRLLPLFYLITCSSVAYTQTIKGTVFDQETKKPIAFATVFFNGTSVASFTDENGYFILESKKNINLPLTIRALGYYSIDINDFSPDKEITVYLKPKVFEIKEVNVSAKRDIETRSQNLEIFKKEFLGRTQNSKECEIINEDDIRFITSSNKDTIFAYSKNPIKIHNNALGYEITYYLEKFEYSKSESLVDLVGKFLFVEDSISDLNKQKLENKRSSVYFGSKMHFIRSLWHNDLKSEGFFVRNSKRKLSYKDLVRVKLNINPDQTKKYLFSSSPFPINLMIRWKPGHSTSGIYIYKDFIYFDETGYFEGSNIIWYGEMAKQGIADLLPYEYMPTLSNK